MSVTIRNFDPLKEVLRLASPSIDVAPIPEGAHRLRDHQVLSTVYKYDATTND